MVKRYQKEHAKQRGNSIWETWEKGVRGVDVEFTFQGKLCGPINKGLMIQFR